jgi:hypothetical protein
MKSSRGNKTTAQNLEERFDRGEVVLDYFDLSKARVVHPQSKGAARKKLAYSVKEDSRRRAMVREKSAHYRKRNSERG